MFVLADSFQSQLPNLKGILSVRKNNNLKDFLNCSEAEIELFTKKNGLTTGAEAVIFILKEIASFRKED